MLCISGGSDQRGLYIVCRCSPVNKSITDRYVSTYVVLPGTDGIHTVYPPPLRTVVITKDWVMGMVAVVSILKIQLFGTNMSISSSREMYLDCGPHGQDHRPVLVDHNLIH